jgi:GNAT superfamily N-acetyltransferase
VSSSADTATLRPARAEDVEGIVALLADDVIGALRENPEDLAPYREAFARLEADPNQTLLVAEFDGRLVGCLQLTVIPGLALQGATRSIIEAVRVSSAERGSGLGTRMITWAVEESGRLGVDLVQLTSDRSRTDAHRFYERLGFVPSHLGFKRAL